MYSPRGGKREQERERRKELWDRLFFLFYFFVNVCLFLAFIKDISGVQLAMLFCSIVWTEWALLSDSLSTPVFFTFVDRDLAPFSVFITSQLHVTVNSHCWPKLSVQQIQIPSHRYISNMRYAISYLKYEIWCLRWLCVDHLKMSVWM